MQFSIYDLPAVQPGLGEGGDGGRLDWFNRGGEGGRLAGFKRGGEVGRFDGFQRGKVRD